jgi:class 6 POU domain transcription factor
VGNLLTSAAAQPTTALPQLLAAPQPAAMPQFILASGQLVQGIQGAQLLIPTSQGMVHITHFCNNVVVTNVWAFRNRFGFHIKI